MFEVLAEENRRRILDLLVEDERPVGDLVGILSLSQPSVSKHLKVLREAELVSVREEGQHRLYSLVPTPLDEVDDWLMPFVVDESEVVAAALDSTLPEPAAHAAEVVGRAAASAKHAVASAFRKLPGRP